MNDLEVQRGERDAPRAAGVVVGDSELAECVGVAVLAPSLHNSRNSILSLSQAAERRLRSHGAYRAELNHWTSRHPARRGGIPPSAIGPWDAFERLPLRDFGLLAPQVIRSAERFEPYPTIVLLSTLGDGRPQWVAAGQVRSAPPGSVVKREGPWATATSLIFAHVLIKAAPAAPRRQLT